MIDKAAALLTSAVLALLLAGACGSEPTREEKLDGDRGRTTNIGRPPTVVFGSSYVSPLTEDFGDVLIGEEVFISSSTILRAAPDLRVEIGDRTTIHDNVIVRAREDSVTIGERTAVAHHGIVRDSEVGDAVYVGYNAEVSDSRVGEGSVVYHGARIEGVEIPENRFVGTGEEITDQAAADALPELEESGVDRYYIRDLLEIDQELREGYIALYEEEGYGAVVDVGANPRTSFNPEQIEPRIPESVEIQELARVLGDVQIGENSSVGRRTSVRADEGTPILIGPGALIEDRVTFHAIRGTEVQIGGYLVAGDDAVLHGPLEMGDGDVVGEGAVVFRARVGDNVQIGEGALVVGPPGDGLTLEIPDDTLIPASAVITSESDLQD